jgi:hypothetical protein
MSKAPLETDCDKLLFVEGATDSMFYRAFLKHLGRLDGVWVKDFLGKKRLLKRTALENELRPDRLKAIKAVAIMVDADDNASGTIHSLRDSLKAILGRDVTEGEWSNGAPRVGFFVTPDGKSPGEIETLVWNVWSAKQEHAAGKASVLTHLATMEATGWPAQSADKARISAFLAAAYDEDPRLGAGAREGLFDFDDPGFARLRKFLTEFTEVSQHPRTSP